MKKRIWIVNYYTSSHPLNHRYIEFAKHFMEQGYEVVTVNSSVDEEIEMDCEYEERMYGNLKFLHIRTPKYIGNGLKRIISIWSFAWKIFRLCKKFECPDVILHNVHAPFDLPVLWAAKRLKCKYIAEVWDLWPHSFASVGLVSENNPALKIAYKIEKHIYKQADAVVFTFEGGRDYLASYGWTENSHSSKNLGKVYYNNNGINISDFDHDVISYPRPDEDLNDPSIYKIIYMGAIRLANNLKQLIDAAAILKDNPKYKFFIYGEGCDREYLENYVKEHGISNVIFKEKRIPFCEVAWVVSQATVNVMNYSKTFGAYGVSSGKMFQYFAAGKPICCNIKLDYSEITRRNLGCDKFMDSPEEYAEAIRSLAEQPKEAYDAMCARVRKAGEDFDLKKLSAKELSIIESVIS